MQPSESRGVISRERLEAAPGAIYTETILKPVFEFKKLHYFYPLVEVNLAWTVMLARTRIIAAEDGRQLALALRQMEAACPACLGDYNPAYEYFYSHLERALTQITGEDIAGNINIARTRPEPLARMVIRRRLLEVMSLLIDLRETLLELAARDADTVMPQWTHFQHAQISTVGHYLLAIVDVMERGNARLLAAYAVVNQSTLGCGALAGTSYAIDRQLVADLLGFSGVKENAIDCVSGGDHLMTPAAALASIMVTLSRLCQDLYIWHTWEFGLIEIADDFAGSSSMMPQKKNPYPFEYVRARAAMVSGAMSTVFETLRNTNFQDIKDVEEDAVYPLLDAFEETERSLRLLNGALASLRFNAEAMQTSAARGFATSTELAAALHRHSGLSYRTTHRIVGETVLRALKLGLDASQVRASLVNDAAEKIIGRPLDIDDALVQSALAPAAFVRAHDSLGGPAPAEIRRMRERAGQQLRRDKQLLANLADQRLSARISLTGGTEAREILRRTPDRCHLPTTASTYSVSCAARASAGGGSSGLIH